MNGTPLHQPSGSRAMWSAVRPYPGQPFPAADARVRHRPLRRATQAALAREARAYIRRNFADEELAGTSRMAQELRVTPSHLCHVYRQTFGITIGQQVSRLRVAKAARLFERSDLAAKQVAAEVGFARATYRAFLNAFHRETGMSPTAYRRLVRRTQRRLRLRDGRLILQENRVRRSATAA